MISRERLKEIVREELEKTTANEGIFGDTISKVKRFVTGDKPSGSVHPPWRDATDDDALNILHEALWDLIDGYKSLGHHEIAKKLETASQAALSAAKAGKTTRG